MNSQTFMDHLLDVQEAAAFLRIKPSTLYGWVHQRRVPFRKHGSKVLFLMADLLAWSKSKEISPINGSSEPDFNIRGNGIRRRKAASSLKTEQNRSRSMTSRMEANDGDI